MTKKHFIDLADTVRSIPVREVRIGDATVPIVLYQDMVDALAHFCRQQNTTFMRGRWMDYIAGACGPSGGAPKKQ